MHKIACAFLLMTLPLSGAIYHQIDTTSTLSCSFSSKHHNRILIDQGRVKKIIFPEEKLHVRMEEVSGQVFVQPKYFSSEPIVVSIITQEGDVQDIEITFSDCPSQVIVLQDSCGMNDPILGVYEEPSICICSSLDECVNHILQGKIPAGYQSTTFRGYAFKPKFGISAKLVGKLAGCVDTLFIYELTNTTFVRRKMLEKEITCPGAIWGFVQKNCLGAREKILAIVAVHNE